MIKYKEKNTCICYTKGMTKQDVIDELKKRISKRKKELDKREWIVDEFYSLSAKQKIDEDWLQSIESGFVKFDSPE